MTDSEKAAVAARIGELEARCQLLEEERDRALAIAADAIDISDRATKEADELAEGVLNLGDKMLDDLSRVSEMVV